jgi:hypothetical protein
MLFCQSAVAQGFSVNETDPATGNRTIITKNYKGQDVSKDDNIARNGMVFLSAGYQSTHKDDKVNEIYFIDLNIVHNDNRLGCLKHETGKIILTFEDGTTVECMQVSETSCDKFAFDGGFALVPRTGGTDTTMKDVFTRLQTVNLKAIEVFTTQTTMNFTVKTSEKERIKSHFALVEGAIRKNTAVRAATAN